MPKKKVRSMSNGMIRCLKCFIVWTFSSLVVPAEIFLVGLVPIMTVFIIEYRKWSKEK